MVPAISCVGLVKRYQDVTAVAGLDLTVGSGECFGLLGPNGAGKTTTVEILEGLTPPSQGEVRLLGLHWKTDPQALRERIGVSLQETHLHERLTVGETLQMFRSFYARGRDVDDLIKLVSLQEKRNVYYQKLSGGQKQRVALACALIGDPDLLFLDEPTTGLDPQSRRQVWELVEELRKQGKTILLTTHYMEEAERLCDRVAIIDRGKIIAQGTPRELIASMGGEEIVECKIDPLPADLDSFLATLPGVQSVRRSGDCVALVSQKLHVTLPALLVALEQRKLVLTQLSTHRATLEDVFVALTGRQLRD